MQITSDLSQSQINFCENYLFMPSYVLDGKQAEQGVKGDIATFYLPGRDIADIGKGKAPDSRYQYRAGDS